jgi:hypothetical protein
MVVVVNAVKKEAAADECTEESSKASSIFIGTTTYIFVAFCT